MNWLINKIFKWGKNDYRLRLSPDKGFKTQKYPITWSGEVAGYIDKTGQLERAKITLRQDNSDAVERVEFPEFADGIYEDVIKEIQSILRAQG